jgi:hypothetical protein
VLKKIWPLFVTAVVGVTVTSVEGCPWPEVATPVTWFAE